MENKDILAPYTKWQESSPGGMVRCTGNAEEYDTGGWSAIKPVINWEKCKQCMFCPPICPDSSIPVKDGKRGEFDYKHCKGCGACAKTCPFGAIEMKVMEGGQNG